MILGIDPKVDYAFKHFLGRDEMRPILIDVLEKILDRTTATRIVEIELLNPFNPKEAFDDKLSILDIKARDDTGRQFNVEMQLFAPPSYLKRVVYYACKMHQQQLREGDGYSELRPTISISFVNNVLFPKASDYHLRFRLLEIAHGFPLVGDIEFHILELPKFTKSAEESSANSADIWLYFLRHAEKMDTEAMPTALRQPLVRKAMEDLKMLAQSELERERYEARRKAQLDYDSGLTEARLIGREEGQKIGREEGQKIGRIQLCERLLNRGETSTEQLAALSLEELTRLAGKLEDMLSHQ